MKIHDVSLKRLMLKLKRIARKMLGKKRQDRAKKIRHTSIRKDHSHSIHGAHRSLPDKDGE